MTAHIRHRRFENPATAFPVPIEPGEIAINTANRQIVAGDAAPSSPGVPLPLIAVRVFDERAQYAANEFAVQGDTIWRAIAPIVPGAFDPSHWDAYPDTTAIKNYADAGDALRVAKAGDTMTGPLVLHANPVTDLEAATKLYVDSQVLPEASFATDPEVVAGVVGNKAVTPATLRNEMAREFGIPAADFAGQIASAIAAANRLVKTGGDGKVGLGLLPTLTASIVTFAPVGELASTTVQAALAELDDEKAAEFHTHDIDDVIGLDTALDAKASLVSPAFVDTPTAPTAPFTTNTTQLATTAFVQQEQRRRRINRQIGTAYTFVANDPGAFCTFNNALPVAVTIPPNSAVPIEIGAQIDVAAWGAGQVSFVAGAGVLIRSEDGKKKLARQYSGGTLIKEDTDVWFLTGSLAT